MLRNLESGAQLPTKIEFSRRGLDAETSVGPVDPAIIRAYRLYPVIVPHYGVSSAFAQKVSALALRNQVPSRDVFDLKLLLDAGGTERPLRGKASEHIAAAIANARAVDYDAFAGQVLAYLEPEYQEYYGARKTWIELRQQVVNALEALRP